MRCGYCGAPEFGIVDGRCRYCGTAAGIESAPARVATIDSPTVDWERAWATPEPPPPRPYLLSYSGSLTYLWQRSTARTDRPWAVAACTAVLLIAAAWYGVFCWRLVANVLYWFDRRQEPGPVATVLRAANEHPWIGFLLGTVPVSLILLSLCSQLQHA